VAKLVTVLRIAPSVQRTLKVNRKLVKRMFRCLIGQEVLVIRLNALRGFFVGTMHPRSMTRSFVRVVTLIDACVKECVGESAFRTDERQTVWMQFALWRRCSSRLSTQELTFVGNLQCEKDLCVAQHAWRACDRSDQPCSSNSHYLKPQRGRGRACDADNQKDHQGENQETDPRQANIIPGRNQLSGASFGQHSQTKEQ